MGCCASSDARAEAYKAESKEPGAQQASKAAETASKAAEAQPASAGHPQISNYKPKKPKLDPKDFQFVGLKGEVKVKPPGSINGQAFTINNCEDCDIYLIDACAQVTIDNAKNCRLFVGPCEGSLFIRDSVNCKVAAIVRQLRTRDCHDVDTALLCRTRPIIESSSNMGFACYDLNYETLPAHLKAAKLLPIHNFWSYIYDFTPKPGNWKLLGPEATVESLLGPKIPDEALTALGKHGKEGSLLITWGDRTPTPSPDYMFAIFPEKHADDAMQFANEAKHKATVLRCNKAVLTPDQASQMTQLAGWARTCERDLTAGQGMCVGFEVSGPGCHAALHGLCHALGGFYTDNEQAGAIFRYLGIDN